MHLEGLVEEGGVFGIGLFVAEGRRARQLFYLINLTDVCRSFLFRYLLQLLFHNKEVLIG